MPYFIYFLKLLGVHTYTDYPQWEWWGHKEVYNILCIYIFLIFKNSEDTSKVAVPDKWPKQCEVESDWMRDEKRDK